MESLQLIQKGILMDSLESPEGNPEEVSREPQSVQRESSENPKGNPEGILKES